MNRQNGIASLTLVLLLLVLGTLILTGLNQQLITFTMLVGDESRAIQQQAAAPPDSRRNPVLSLSDAEVSQVPLLFASHRTITQLPSLPMVRLCP